MGCHYSKSVVQKNSLLKTFQLLIKAGTIKLQRMWKESSQQKIL